jgi:hypothetical protein
VKECRILFKGIAKPLFNGQEPVDLKAGEFMNIPAHYNVRRLHGL